MHDDSNLESSHLCISTCCCIIVSLKTHTKHTQNQAFFFSFFFLFAKGTPSTNSLIEPRRCFPNILKQTKMRLSWSRCLVAYGSILLLLLALQQTSSVSPETNAYKTVRYIAQAPIYVAVSAWQISTPLMLETLNSVIQAWNSLSSLVSFIGCHLEVVMSHVCHWIRTNEVFRTVYTHLEIIISYVWRTFCIHLESLFSCFWSIISWICMHVWNNQMLWTLLPHVWHCVCWFCALLCECAKSVAFIYGTVAGYLDPIKLAFCEFLAPVWVALLTCWASIQASASVTWAMCATIWIEANVNLWQTIELVQACVTRWYRHEA